jgi:hypothetical protein
VRWKTGIGRWPELACSKVLFSFPMYLRGLGLVVVLLELVDTGLDT